MKNKKLTILMAEFMYSNPDIKERPNRIILQSATCEYGADIEYDPFENPAQMNDFIEHPDVMMDVRSLSDSSWLAYTNTENIEGHDKHRPTAINKCAAAFFGETYEE